MFYLKWRQGEARNPIDILIYCRVHFIQLFSSWLIVCVYVILLDAPIPQWSRPLLVFLNVILCFISHPSSSLSLSFCPLLLSPPRLKTFFFLFHSPPKEREIQHSRYEARDPDVSGVQYPRTKRTPTVQTCPRQAWRRPPRWERP